MKVNPYRISLLKGYGSEKKVFKLKSFSTDSIQFGMGDYESAIRFPDFIYLEVEKACQNINFGPALRF